MVVIIVSACRTLPDDLDSDLQNTKNSRLVYVIRITDIVLTIKRFFFCGLLFILLMAAWSMDFWFEEWHSKCQYRYQNLNRLQTEEGNYRVITLSDPFISAEIPLSIRWGYFQFIIVIRLLLLLLQLSKESPLNPLNPFFK